MSPTEHEATILKMVDQQLKEYKKTLEENIFKTITIKRNYEANMKGILLYSDRITFEYLVVEIYSFKGTETVERVHFNIGQLTSLMTYPSSHIVSFEEAITSSCKELREQALVLHPDRPLK